MVFMIDYLFQSFCPHYSFTDYHINSNQSDVPKSSFQDFSFGIYIHVLIWIQCWWKLYWIIWRSLCVYSCFSAYI